MSRPQRTAKDRVYANRLDAGHTIVTTLPSPSRHNQQHKTMSSKSPTPLGNSTNTGESQRRPKRRKQSNGTAATTIHDAATAAVSNSAAADGNGGQSSTRRSTQRQRAPPKIYQDPPTSEDEEMESEEESDYEEEEVAQKKKQRGGGQKKKEGDNGGKKKEGDNGGKKKEGVGKPPNKNSTNHGDNHRDKLIEKYRPIQVEMIQNSPKSMVNFPERSNRLNNLSYFYTQELVALKNAFDNEGVTWRKAVSKKAFKQGIHERINKICKHLSKDLKKCILEVEKETVSIFGGVPNRNNYMKEETIKWMIEYKKLAKQKKTQAKCAAKIKFYLHHCQELADAIEEEMINNMSLESDSEDRKSVLGLLAYMDEQTYQWEQSDVDKKRESHKTMAAQVITPVVHQMTVEGINEGNSYKGTGESYLDLGKKNEGGPKGELAVLLYENCQEEMDEEDLDEFMKKLDAVGDKLKNVNLKEG